MPTPAGNDLRSMYRETILEHARSPRHFGELEGATHEAHGVNPLCGDKLHIRLEVRDERIEAIRFDGHGCAISLASASLMTEELEGCSVDAAIDRAGQLQDALASPPEGISLGRLDPLMGVSEHPSRVKCATLAWSALVAALREDSTSVTTE